MAKQQKTKKKTVAKKRPEIRVIDVPQELYDKIKTAAKKADRSMGKEVYNKIKDLY